jgi:hypothetical protein
MKCFQIMQNNVIVYALCTYMQLYSSIGVVEPYYDDVLTHKKMLKATVLVLNLKRSL